VPSGGRIAACRIPNIFSGNTIFDIQALCGGSCSTSGASSSAITKASPTESIVEPCEGFPLGEASSVRPSLEKVRSDMGGHAINLLSFSVAPSANDTNSTPLLDPNPGLPLAPIASTLASGEKASVSVSHVVMMDLYLCGFSHTSDGHVELHSLL